MAWVDYPCGQFALAIGAAIADRVGLAEFSIRLGYEADFYHFWLSKMVLMLGFGVGFVTHLAEDIGLLTPDYFWLLWHFEAG